MSFYLIVTRTDNTKTTIIHICFQIQFYVEQYSYDLHALMKLDDTPHYIHVSFSTHPSFSFIE